MIGKFITVEGIEGVGKSTHMAFIEEFLRAQGLSVVSTREPGGTPLAEAIRDLVLTPREETISPDTELLLIFASRAQHIAQVILPALERGEWVISDRFIDATYAYQGGGRHIAMKRIDELAEWTLKGLTPDLTLLLDAPVELALSRAKTRSSVGDRFENEKNDFFTDVRDVYLSRAKAESERIKIIDAAASLEQVQQKIKETMNSFISE